MLLTSTASVWKIFFALFISLAVILLVYSFIKKFVPAAEFVSAVLFLFIYAAIVRWLTV